MDTNFPEPPAYPLFHALRDRRSRRFGLGMTMPAGPLAYASRYEPVPLTETEEATLVWAACGITGPALGDLCYAAGQGGNIMAGMMGRTAASGDCLQTSALVVLNDQGTWFVRRPQDFPPGEVRALAELSRAGDFTAAYRRLRVQLSDQRRCPKVEPITSINCNRWSQHARGSSYFLPVGDLTPMYINGLLEILNEETGVFVLDERANYRPAGLARFARSRGGHLDDDPAHGKVATIRQVEQLVTDFINVEQGMMLQNLGLMTQSLGLGGFPHFANHEFAWTEALGFRMVQLPASRYLGAPWLVRLGLRLTGRDAAVPLPIGLEQGSASLLRALCPPNYPSMEDAVNAVLALKFGATGTFGNPEGNSAWRERSAVTAGVSRISDRAVAATVAYCEYVWDRYGRFPALVPPFRCSLAHQVTHVDTEFYDRFYRPEALSETQHCDFATVSKTFRKS